MGDVVDINDHQGRFCDCGCTRWALLRSGKIECHACGDVLDGAEWREKLRDDEATYCVAQTATVERMENIMVEYCNKNPVTTIELGEVVADLRLILLTEHRAPST